MEKVTKMFKKNKKLQFLESFKHKLDVIESIRSVLTLEGFEVPGIVVAGSQSSGKSSVLESISGISLPRGSNITTRVPIILRLEHINDEQAYAMMSTYPDFSDSERIDDLSTIADNINSLTRRVTPNEGSISDTPIYLKVLKSDNPNLTIIDLPGITHMSYNEMQTNIHEETVNLVKRYVKNPQMIILCVVPAGDDFANCEAIKIAKEVDPQGLRTLGVITKIDLCNEKITDKIKGEQHVKLKLGFVAVKNKGTDDITLKDARKSEKKYFNTHYELLENEYWGVPTLISKITKLQNDAIAEFIPSIKVEIHNKILTLENTLSDSKFRILNESDKVKYITKIIIDMNEDLKNFENDPKLFAFFKGYSTSLDKLKPDFFSEEYFEFVKEKIRNLSGTTLANFLSMNVFLSLFDQSQVKKITLVMVEHIQEYIRSQLQIFSQKYSLVSNFLEDKSYKLHDENVENLKTVLNSFFESQEFVFTQDDAYSENILQIKEMTQVTTNEDHTIYELQTSLVSYSHIFYNRLRDMVPMFAYLYLVRRLISQFSCSALEDVTSFTLNDKNLMKEKQEMATKLENFRIIYDRIVDISS